MFGLESPGRLNTIHDWHGNIDNDDVRLQIRHRFEQRPPVGHRPHKLALIFQEASKPLDDEGMVIGQ
jgi:hypothetical protein